MGSGLYEIYKHLYFPFLFQYKIYIIVYFIVLCVLYFLQPIMLPKLLNRFLDHVATTGQAKSLDVYMLVGILLLIAIVGYMKNCFDAFLPTRQFQWIREELFDRLFVMLQTQVHTIRTGEFITLMNYLPREIRYLSENIINLMPGILGYVFLWMYTCFVNIKAAMVFGIGLLINIWILTSSPLVAKLAQESRIRTEYIMKNNSKITEDVTQLDHIYANNQTTETLLENSRRENNLQNAFENSVHTSNIIMVILSLWNIFVFSVTALIIYKEDTTPRRNAFRSYVFILGFFLSMLWNIFHRFITFIMASQSVFVYYHAFNEMIRQNDESSSVSSPTGGGIDASTVTDATIQFTDVFFRYSSSTPWILSDFKWTIPEKSRWVLIGPSGKGKSTLLKLMMRFFPPTSGTITLGNVPIEEYDISSLRELICLINQETLLFEKSIYENIVFGNAGVSEEEVIAVLSRYNLLKNFQREASESGMDIMGRSCGIDGKDLSKGQQKIVILARALFRNDHSRIYLMDEPLASLDRSTQENVLRWIVDTIPDKTVVFTTHITDHSLFQNFQIMTLSSS